ncbi:hypothetical protein N8H74_25290 [Pseudomonas sp. B2M1-30]|uniref:hypothetical protein n=1 Tax=Pseudomonas TaxID=286 RepID=UPI0021C67530|nr:MULTISPECIES: hypothetical protein [Pseudomonas]MCU0121587.1 hypothetical protein [Pseudomonas sp. B2M1-30]MCU7261315.1 hypothetical protein [Pseudomonas koreensis]
MENLTKLRIGLTIGAIVGFLPITLLFTAGLIGIFIPAMFIPPTTPFVVAGSIGICIISIFGIGSAWKIYSLAMAASPNLRNSRLLAFSAVVTMSWGLIIAYYTREIPQATCIFLMPGIVSSIMLAITQKRVRA